MSEIKCNKLEITSLRQCDSIKFWGNIGPCIIEGPARQDSCQACQPCRSYWIWPVTHTQISPVKITGYIDFLFLFVSACECVRALMWESVCMSVRALSACMYSYACLYSILSMCVLFGGVLKCGSAGRAGYKSGVGDHAGLRAAATSGATNFGGRPLHVLSGAGASCAQTHKPHDRPQLLLF